MQVHLQLPSSASSHTEYRHCFLKHIFFTLNYKSKTQFLSRYLFMIKMYRAFQNWHFSFFNVKRIRASLSFHINSLRQIIIFLMLHFYLKWSSVPCQNENCHFISKCQFKAKLFFLYIFHVETIYIFTIFDMFLQNFLFQQDILQQKNLQHKRPTKYLQ